MSLGRKIVNIAASAILLASIIGLLVSIYRIKQVESAFIYIPGQVVFDPVEESKPVRDTSFDLTIAYVCGGGIFATATYLLSYFWLKGMRESQNQ